MRLGAHPCDSTATYHCLIMMYVLQVKEPAQPKVVSNIGSIQGAIQKAQKAIQRNDFEMHAKTVSEVGR